MHTAWTATVRRCFANPGSHDPVWTRRRTITTRWPINTREEVLAKRRMHLHEDFQLAKHDDLQRATGGDFRLALDSPASGTRLQSLGYAEQNCVGSAS
jgi:hypothetical protein